MNTEPSLIDVLTNWTFEPSVVLGVVLTVGIYIAGIRELRRRERYGKLVSTTNVVSFSLGILCILLALESPVDAYSVDLFSVHMVQHVLLLSFAPPLLLLGKPIPVLLVGAPRNLVKAVARAHVRQKWFHTIVGALTNPTVAWIAYMVAMFGWHTPALYQAALENQNVHLLEHVCYLVTGLMFWWVVIQPFPGRSKLAYGWRFLSVTAALALSTGLSVIFLLAQQPIYPFYAKLPRLWGISALDDQSTAGTIMMGFGDTVLLVAAAILVIRLLDQLDRKEFARAAALEEATRS